jgi:hypothetical protein
VAGKNSYRKGSYIIVWNSSGSGAWFIQDFPTSKYASTSDVVSPDLAIDWGSYGAGTAPTVISGPCPSPTPTNTTTPTNTPTPTNTQTPSSTPPSPVCVAGAGDTGVNGTYTFNGIVNGRNSYVKDGIYIITWQVFAWFITNISSGGDRYQSNDNVITPDLVTTWTPFNGPAPVPVVSSGPC